MVANILPHFSLQEYEYQREEILRYLIYHVDETVTYYKQN